jgi:hypothetical protein
MFQDVNTRTAARTAESLRTALEGWRSTMDSWFDGTPGSISARVAGCDKLIHRFRQAGHGYHGTIAELQRHRSQLADMRNSLLHTANADRETPVRVTARPQERHRLAARAFLREQYHPDRSELQIRADRHADLHGLDPAFTATVLFEARTIPQQQQTRVASAPPTAVTDFADELMFM